MAVRKVLKMGDPLLYQRAEEVRAFHTPDLDALIRDMFDTMAALNGAGLAAPQIGVSQRVVIFEVQSNPRYPEVEAVPRTILINPVLEPIGAEMDDGWEGCLSVPGLRGLVSRYKNCVIQASTRTDSILTARCPASMPAWCSTNATTSTASFIPCASRISACSVSRRRCPRPINQKPRFTGLTGFFRIYRIKS